MTATGASNAAGLAELRAELFALMDGLAAAGGLDDANGSWLDRRVDAWLMQATVRVERSSADAAVALESRRSAARVAVQAAETALAHAERLRDRAAQDPALKGSDEVDAAPQDQPMQVHDAGPANGEGQRDRTQP